MGKNCFIAKSEGIGEHVRMVVGSRQQIVVSLDWTEYDSTDQSRLSLNLITRHGRSTPLVWITVKISV